MRETVLVIAPEQIGSHLAQFPFYSKLRKSFPKAEIQIWVTQKVVPFLIPGSFDSVETVDWSAHDGVIQSGLFAIGKWRAVAKLRPSHVFDLNEGGNQNQFFRILSCQARRLQKEPGIHRSQAGIRLLSADDKTPVSDLWKMPNEKWLTEGAKLKPPSQRYWILAPGSSEESKTWNGEEWRQLLRLLIEARPEMKEMKCVVVGAGEEIEWIKSVRQLEGQIEKGTLLDQVAQGPLFSYIDVIKNAQFVVGLDHDWTHLASFLGVPVHLVWGGGDPTWSSPVGLNRVGLSFHGVPCWPCEKPRCEQQGDRKLACTRSLSARQVYEEIKNGIFQSVFDPEPGTVDPSEK